MNNVITVTAAPDRTASVQVKLTSHHKMSITQIYAPTSMFSEEELENFYDDPQTIKSHDKSPFMIIMGDFKLVKETYG